MKKLSIIIIALLLITALAITAFAAELGVGVSASANKATRGETITVTISIPEKFSCKSGFLALGFDNSVFERTKSEWLLTGTDYANPDGDAAFILKEEREISGDIFRFQLTVSSTASLGDYPLNVTLILRDSNGNSYTADKKLTVTIECDHKFDTGEVTKEATCSEEGTRIRTCTRCGEKRTDKIAKLGHQYDAGQVEETPTCTEEGKLVYTCTRCKTTKSEKIDPTGHAYDDDCDSECNNCGETRTVEHNYGDYWTSDASGHWHGCIDCGHVLELFPHNPGPEATETTEQICLDCHYVLQPCKPHEHTAVGDWLGDEEHHWNKCACGENFDEGVHQWNEGDVNESTGEVTYLCTVCGYSKTVAQETVPPTQPDDPGTDPTRPGQQGGEEKEANPWIVVSLILAILLAASWIYIILGIVGGKKRGGKFSS
ncbi:MAG: hypothetical protein E7436_03995 [Ruminococcaceae bacterium]|nr:hypothetical protein [Oscillospiraceae bacterium]